MTRMVWSRTPALLFFLFIDKCVRLHMAEYDHRTMPELTWDHLKSDSTVSWFWFWVSRREKQIGPVWVRYFPRVWLAMVRRWGHRAQTRQAELTSVQGWGGGRGVSHTGKHVHSLKMLNRDIHLLMRKESQSCFEWKKQVTKYVYHILKSKYAYVK